MGEGKEKSLDRQPTPRCGHGAVSGKLGAHSQCAVRALPWFPAPTQDNAWQAARTAVHCSGLCDTWPDAHYLLETLSPRNFHSVLCTVRARTPQQATVLPVPRAMGWAVVQK